MYLETISQLYVTPEMAKSEKYKRFHHEKRVKRTPGVKRIQTEKYTKTKWEPEIAKNKANKIERKRDRYYKYGKWDYGRTDTRIEDTKNEKAREATREKLRVAALERQGIYQRKNLDDYSNLIFPVFHLNDKDNWPTWAWEAYYEMKDTEEVKRDAMSLLVKPGKIVGFKEAEYVDL